MPEKAGLLNAYICPHLHTTVTINRHEGTTPFMIGCRHPVCKEMASSQMYHIDQTLDPTHEFYAPTGDELEAAILKHPESEEWFREHVSMGGLLFRKIES